MDYCRYYAAEAQRTLARAIDAGPDRRDRTSCAMRGRGVFVCISPWNFPLAIFFGQVTAALAGRQRGGGEARRADAADRGGGGAAAASGRRAGERAAVSCRAMARIGAALTARSARRRRRLSPAPPRSARIDQPRAGRQGRADRAADRRDRRHQRHDRRCAPRCPSRSTDDVVTSAFRSAGQRCSALRLLCVQEDVADRIIEMIAGAALELEARRSRAILATHVGPVIDAEAKQRLDRWLDIIARKAAMVFRWDAGRDAARRKVCSCRRRSSRLDRRRRLCRKKCSARSCTWCAGAPTISTSVLRRRSSAPATGSRSASTRASTTTVEARSSRGLQTGNIYVNRNMIGAVVGVQPFGGSGLSGTGPKAGGPHYLRALRHRADGDRSTPLQRAAMRPCSQERSEPRPATLHPPENIGLMLR